MSPREAEPEPEAPQLENSSEEGALYYSLDEYSNFTHPVSEFVYL